MMHESQNVIIKRNSVWYSEPVRDICIKEGWYTAGNTQDYEKMLKFVDENPPTDNNIYLVAADILRHTHDFGLQVESVMFELANFAVTTSFSLLKTGVASS